MTRACLHVADQQGAQIYTMLHMFLHHAKVTAFSFSLQTNEGHKIFSVKCLSGHIWFQTINYADPSSFLHIMCKNKNRKYYFHFESEQVVEHL